MSRLALILSGVQAASVVKGDEAVRTGASELLAEIAALQRTGRESGKPELLCYSHLPGSGAGIWLVESSANSMLEQLSSSRPDWDQVGVSASFAESGVQQFQDAINGRTFSDEELDDAVAWTITHIEARLQDKDLPSGSRESLTEQLRPPISMKRPPIDYGAANGGQNQLSRIAGLPKGDVMEIINLGATDGLPPVNWENVLEKLDAGSSPAPDAHNARTTWLSTLNEDGSPHVTAVGALWLDGSFWFQTGSGTRKARNVARDPRCSIAVSILDADVVAEGRAERETDPATLTRLAQAWADQGWPAELDETRTGITAPFNAPSQGPPPWNVYRIKPASVTVTLGTEPGGLTRFRF